MCTGSLALADVHYFIQMHVNDAETEMVIDTRKGDAGGCSGLNRKKGCIRANRGDQIKVSFLLSGNAKCSASEGAVWKLGDVVLGGKNSSSKPGSWGGFGSDTQVTNDFDFADAGKGILNTISPSNDRQITITDKNKSSYIIFYKVTADCVDASGNSLKTIATDPRIENKGDG